MKVTPVASPHNVAAPMAGAQTQSSAVARDRAIQAAMGSNPVPVNANNVSPEELNAVTPPTPQPTEIAAVEETPTQEVKEPVVETDPALVRQYNHLARQERQHRLKVQQQDQALKAREAALASREAELTAKDNTYRTEYIPKARLKQDALGVLEAEGIATYDDLTQRAISRQPVDPMLQATVSKLEAKITQLEQDAITNQTKATEQQSANYQAAVKQITRDAKDLVKNDPEFEAIRAEGTVRDVVELITRHHSKTGEILSVEEAARQVESDIIERGLKLTRIEKIKQRMNQSNASTGKSNQQTQANQQTQPQMKTLTNAQSSTRQLSARERALLAFKGELKG